MNVKTVHRTVTVGPSPNKSYNPSIFIPESIWKRLQNKNITIKSLVLLGWKTQRSRDTKPIDTILSYYENENRRLIDILSTIGPVEDKKKIHLKFMSREFEIASRIYEQHIKLHTTMSNYLLYLLILGMYLRSRVILNYSTSEIDRREAQEDESTLKRIIEKILLKRLEKDNIFISKSIITRNLIEISRRSFIKHVKKIERLDNPEDLARYLLENVIFNVRPSKSARYYVKIC
ncbi:MAG: hypothetical protein GXO26_09620, partial [Crenarchaeota archaeon]|nr:hypothetical protein [Thermoproteota archaeon]